MDILRPFAVASRRRWSPGRWRPVPVPIPEFVTTEGAEGAWPWWRVVALMLGCATIMQLTGYRLESLRAQALGLVVMICG